MIYVYNCCSTQLCAIGKMERLKVTAPAFSKQKKLSPISMFHQCWCRGSVWSGSDLLFVCFIGAFGLKYG